MKKGCDLKAVDFPCLTWLSALAKFNEDFSKETRFVGQRLSIIEHNCEGKKQKEHMFDKINVLD